MTSTRFAIEGKKALKNIHSKIIRAQNHGGRYVMILKTGRQDTDRVIADQIGCWGYKIADNQGYFLVSW